jgi:hypothetical protein
VFRVLLSGSPRECHTSIWPVEEKIALIGNYAQGVERLKKFFSQITNQHATQFIDEAIEFLEKPENVNEYFILECGELYAMVDENREAMEKLNYEVLEEVRYDIDEDEEIILEEINSFEPRKKGKSRKNEILRQFYEIGLGYWSNILYYHFGAED